MINNKMINHTFNVWIAEQYGVESAIILHNMQYWIKHNEANQKNFHDGAYWTYNSTKALAVLFPYWSSKKIENHLKKLREDGILKTGNYNSTPYDRTLWYAFTKKGECLYQINGDTPSPEIIPSNSPNKEMENIKKDNGNTENVKTLNNIYIPDIKQSITLCEKNSFFSEEEFTQEELMQVNKFIQLKKEKKQAYTPTGLQGLKDKLLEYKNNGYSIIDIIKPAIAGGYGSLLDPKTPPKSHNVANNPSRFDREAVHVWIDSFTNVLCWIARDEDDGTHKSFYNFMIKPNEEEINKYLIEMKSKYRFAELPRYDTDVFTSDKPVRRLLREMFAEELLNA